MDNSAGSTVTVEAPATEPAEGSLEAQKDMNLVKYWLDQMRDAVKREKTWRKQGRDCVELYEAGKRTSFNMLYSNTETLMPALYSNSPKPAVARRIKTEPTPVAMVASDLLNKSLTWTLDTNDEDYNEFDDIMSEVVLSALVPGRGQAWFNYDAKFAEVSADDLEELKERDDTKTGTDEKVTLEKVSDENICPEIVPWDQFLQGYAKSWKKVPWVARVYIYTKTDVEKHWPDRANLITYCEESDELESADQQKSNDKTAGAPLVTTVYQIWDKTTRKVYHICSGYPFGPLDEPIEDPLGLSGFFPCPEPLRLSRKLSDMIPVPLYKFYEEQAKELEDVTQRLRGLVKAMRIRGMYVGLVDDIAKVLDAEENTMIPVTNSAGLNDKALAQSIFMVPIQDYVPVIQELWNQRTQIKQVIYEVTGISDIIRGSTIASETATAQDIKNRWGTIRLQDMQKRVQKFSRNCLRIMAEMMSGQYDMEKFSAVTGVQLMTTDEKSRIQMAMQQAQQAFQQQPQQPPQPGQPPQQPQGPQIPPQIQQMLQMPAWEEVIEFLRNDVMRQYRIDIETDSTLADDVKQDKAELAEIMQGLTQMIQALTPAVQGGLLPFDAAKSLMYAFVSRFRIGSEVEQALQQMQQPPPQDDAASKLDMQMKQMEMVQKQKEGDQKLQIEKVKADNDARKMQMEMALAEREHAFRLEEMQLAHELAMVKLQGQLAANNQKMAMQQRQHEQSLQANEQQAQLGQMQHQQTLEANDQQAELANTQHQQSMEAGQQKADLGAQQFKQKQAAIKQQAAAKPAPKGD